MILAARVTFAVGKSGSGFPVPGAAQASEPSGLSRNSQSPPQAPSHPQNQKLVITVLDENAVAVPSVLVILTQSRTPTVFRGETDYAGRCEFTNLSQGQYGIKVQKEGFYEFTKTDLEVGETESVEVTLNHQREYVERVNVTESPPAIDPQKTNSSERLGSGEIVDLPYIVPRDIRYALPLLPGVLQDSTAQVHVEGSDVPQTYDRLDGFQINGPAFGAFNLRPSVDAVRSVEVQGSRYAAEFGKGSGGILSLETGMGDDRYRYSATDLLPSLQQRNGLHLNTWTPRGTLSGPLAKGKAWFLLAPEGEYDVRIVQELPAGQDEATAWRLGSLAKAQINLTPGNILTGSFLINRFGASNAGLSLFNPVATTVDETQWAYLFSLKDQAFLPGGVLLETGVAQSGFYDAANPMGDETYVISPEGTSGNFFATSVGRSRRLQAMASLVLPSVQALGRHELKLGIDIDRIAYHQSYERNPFQIVREDGTLDRSVSFSANPFFIRNNFEASGFAQDRWSVSDHWLVESGVRLDWDEIVRHALVSPRLASTYLLTRRGETKLVAGVGLYYDETSLGLVTLPDTGQRTDVFYDSSGKVPIGPPVITSFRVNEQNLKEPRVLNWSVGVERKLPGSIYSRFEFIQKRGYDGLAYYNQCAMPVSCFNQQFALENEKRDRYDAFRVNLRRTLKGNHFVLASYTRSHARSTAVLDFTLTNPLFSQQAGGPLPWDSPNRFLSWGILPLRRGFDLAYTLDWHTGFPFSVVNENQQLVGPPDSRRLPAYFSLNLALERRFRVLGFEWALRAGADNVTNRQNPAAVNNNVDSPHFLEFSGIQGRALTARLRLLGRK